MTAARVHTRTVMGTTVSIRLVHDDDPDTVERAFGWFDAIERACSRFDADSEVQRLARRGGEPLPVSDILLETTRFALALAADTDGAFDPTVGARLEQRGFDREYRTGARVHTGGARAMGDSVSWRDVALDPDARTITLRRPLLLDLGAVAKGFAVDMAARELRAAGDFAIDAGGDLYLAGHNDRGEPWTVGIRHPRREDETIARVRVSNAAVCTSGDYARALPGTGHHIIDPRGGEPAAALASATVIAPLAMVADGLATAAFVLGPERGLALLERHGTHGLLITPDLERFTTRESQEILSNA